MDKKTYTVREGETLTEIAEKLGDRDFWEAIYNANTDIIDSGLKAGRVLRLPASVTNSPNFVYTDETTEPSEKQQLEKFRDAFNKVIEQKKEEMKEQQGEEQSSAQGDPTLDLGLLILDETRSKLGSDFYNLFYQNWQAPEEASNVSITISEQPSFGRGTMVTIKIDYEQVFSARLQPRYEYIEAVSEQAVARAQRIIQQKASVKQQLMGY